MLHFMAKPTSFRCNIQCDYCFYLSKGEWLDNGSDRKAIMSDAIMEAYIRRMFMETPEKAVYFTWQGGEPLLAPLDFYRKIIATQEKWRKKTGKDFHNAIQTNGMLLDDDWCSFLRQNNFLVGISIDGDEELHDAYRVGRNGKGTWAKVMQGIDLLKKHKVDFNTLTVVNNLNAAHPDRVYSFLKEIGSKYMQFIPVYETRESFSTQYSIFSRNSEARGQEILPFSVPAESYGDFMTRIFDEWIKNDIGRIHIMLFESILARYCGYQQTQCIFRAECGGENLALEAGGDIYQCDHLVYPEFRIGNILTHSLRDIAKATDQLSTVKSALSDTCRSCKWLELCHGGCPKHRINGGPSYFCAGYQRIFSHTMPAFNFMSELKARNMPLSLISKYLEKF